MLGFSPFEDERTLTSDAHVEFMEYLLNFYDKNLTHVAYMVGDNCSTNKKISDITCIPFIGCASHKLNLAVKLWLGFMFTEKQIIDGTDRRNELQKSRFDVLEKLTKLMSKLKTIKGRASLKEYSDYMAIKANETRWNGNQRMINRYVELKEIIKEMTLDKTSSGKELAIELSRLLPTPMEEILIGMVILIHDDH